MSRFDWNNPPPPGTEYEGPEASSSVHNQINLEHIEGTKQIEPSFSQALQSEERAVSPEKTGLRSRSRSHDRRRRRKRSRSYSRRSRSYSRSRRRRSRSHSRRRRRKYSSSRSRSRSPGYRHRQRRRPRHRSRSRSYGSRKKSYKSRSNSRSHSISKSSRSERERKSPKYDYTSQRKRDGNLVDEDIRREDSEEDTGADSQPESDQAPIPFKNDGSFLEMFKKMQEEQKVKEEPPEETVPKKPVFGAFGKRRGGKVLKTGMVAKVRNVEDDVNSAQDAWSVYMQEVRKYKEVHCDDDSKTRPLVK